MYGFILCFCFLLSLTKTRAYIPEPTGLQVQKINGTTAVASWDPIPQQHVQGALLGYNVRLYTTYYWRLERTLQTSNTSIVLRDLKDWLRYRIKVEGYTVNETGYYAYLYFKTPTIPGPTGVNVTKINVNTLEARWDPIPEEHARGAILGYKIQLRYYHTDDLLQMHKTNITKIIISQVPFRQDLYLAIQGFTSNDTTQSTFSGTHYQYPISAVSGLKVAVNGTTAVATWDPIPHKFVFGKLLGYIVRVYHSYFGKMYNDTKTNNSNIVLRDLQLGYAYLIFVAGYTANETGQFNYHGFLTGCGGIIKHQLNGTIKLNFGYHYWYWSFMNCTWYIQGQNSNSLILINVNISRIRFTNCRDGYLRISDGQGRNVTTLCRSTTRSLTFAAFGSVKIDLYLGRWWWYWFEMALSFFITNNGLNKIQYVNVTRDITVNATEGNPIRLSCIGANGTAEWTRDGAKVASNDRVTVQDSVLFISNTTTSDAGIYKCVRKTEKGQNTLLVNLWVSVTVRVKLSLRILNWNFTANITNKSSKEYKAFADNFEKQMDIVYANLTGYRGVEILELLNGSIRVRYRVIVIITVKDKNQKTTRVKVEIVKRVIKRAKNGHVENLQVDSSPEAMEISTPPPTPSDLKILKRYEDAADFKWKKPEYSEYFAIQGYVIEYWPFGSASEKLKTDRHKSDSLKIQDLKADTEYTAHVMAVNKNGNSEESESVRFKTREGSLKDWEIALIVLACVIFLIIIIAIIVWYCRRVKNKEQANRTMFPMKDREKYKEDVVSSKIYSNDPSGAALQSYIIHDNVNQNWKQYRKENLELMGKLGEGEFGTVFKGRLRQNDVTTDCAVKTLRDPANEEGYRDLLKELQIMASVGFHPNLVNLIGAVTEDDMLYVIVEFAANGSLLDFLKKEKQTQLDYKQRLAIGLDVAKGMAFLEKKRCVHRDLAARNVLVDENLHAKVADFGLSRDIYESGVYEKSTTGKLPTRWMALESLELRRFNTKSDVWAFGVLLWEIETNGLIPYGAINFKELVKFLKTGNRLRKPEQTPEELYEFMNICWSVDPGNRPTFADICDIFEGMLNTGKEIKFYQNLGYGIA